MSPLAKQIKNHSIKEKKEKQSVAKLYCTTRREKKYIECDKYGETSISIKNNGKVIEVHKTRHSNKKTESNYIQQLN